MKQSLITQVETIEQEASAIIEDAKKASEKETQSVSKAMAEARSAITTKAEHTSAQIIGEHTKQAEAESHRIIKESNDAVAITHDTAEKNRDRAVAKASQLFAEEYNVPLE